MTRLVRLLACCALALFNTWAWAACWNPLGCTPKTYQECVEQASDAKTDVAAKALIRECDRFKVTEPICVADAKAFKYETLHPNRKAADIRQKLPTLAQLDDEQLAEALQELYYPGKTVGQVEEAMGITSHPDRYNCRRFYEGLYK